ncbi:hypothetical protein AMTRI_Chr11g151660 [Amborella trichopoda]
MAPQYSNSQMESDVIEQLITRFLTKSLHIILEARCPYGSSRGHSGDHIGSSPSSLSSSSSMRRDKWFLLALKECPAALESLELRPQSSLEPMVVDVILLQRTNVERENSPEFIPPTSKECLLRNFSLNECRVSCWNSGDEYSPSSETVVETVIERWVVQYDCRKTNSRDAHTGRVSLGGGQSRKESGKRGNSKSRASKGGGGIEIETGSSCASQTRFNSHESQLAYKKLYKRSTILLRSLYSFVRLLPAYRLFRLLTASSQIYSSVLTYKVFSFVEPLSRLAEAEMMHYTFAPIETTCGRLCVSVSYRPTLVDLNLEASTPLSPKFIPDYVGSPTTEPVKKLSSGSLTPSKNTGVCGVSCPSGVPFARRHSWGNDLYRAAPSGYSNSSPSYPNYPSPSPSPTYSDSRASLSNLSRHRLPPRGPLPMEHSPTFSSPINPSSTPGSGKNLDHRKTTSFDEYWPSPPFSPSSTPSPPTHLSGNNLSRAISRAESAPVIISFDMHGRRLFTPNCCDWNNNYLPPLSPKNRKPDCTSQPDHLGSHIRQFSTSQRSPSEKKFHKKPDTPKTGEFQSGMGAIRTSLNQKTNLGKAVESRQMMSAKKSQDAAVGALVHMLRSAPPLRQDSLNSSKLSQVSNVETQGQKSQLHDPIHFREENPKTESSLLGISSSGFLAPMTAAVAFEELKNYKEMKDFLLKRNKAGD